MLALFSNIRSQLIEKIQNTVSEIKIAMAWFTNEDLFNALLELLDSGKKVSLVVIYDYINFGDESLDFQKFIDKGGELFLGDCQNPMHNKYCIIDSKWMCTGSYNWTYFAESRNYENVVSIDDVNIINQYLENFNSLTANLKKVSEIDKIRLEECSDNFSEKYYKGLDVAYKAAFMNSETLAFASMNLLQNNQEVSRIVHSVINKEKQVRTRYVLNTSLGISARIDDVDNLFAVIITKGTELPCTNESVFYTGVDNQKSVSIKTYKGEAREVIKNVQLGSIFIKDLPPLPKGKATVTVKMEVNESGHLIVSARNDSNNNIMQAHYPDPTLVKQITELV